MKTTVPVKNPRSNSFSKSTVRPSSNKPDSLLCLLVTSIQIVHQGEKRDSGECENRLANQHERPVRPTPCEGNQPNPDCNVRWPWQSASNGRQPGNNLHMPKSYFGQSKCDERRNGTRAKDWPDIPSHVILSFTLSFRFGQHNTAMTLMSPA